MQAFPSTNRIDGPGFDPIQGKQLPVGTSQVYIEAGMALRDYFATHLTTDPTDPLALPLAEKLVRRKFPVGSADPVETALFWADAEAAYRYMRADAMMRARQP